MDDDTREPNDAPRAQESDAGTAGAGEVPADVLSIQQSLDSDATTVLPPLPPLPPEGEPAAQEADAAILSEAPREIEPIPGIDLGPEHGRRTWLWALGIILLLVVLGVFGYGWWYVTARPVDVPRLVGRMPAQAVQALNDAGLKLGKVSEIPTENELVGSVIEQSPAPGSSLKPGDRVAIVIAAAPESARVPQLEGDTETDAVMELARQRLAPLVVDSYDPNIASGSVSAQIPASDTRLSPGSLVVIVVSKGPAPAQTRVPRLSGMREADAAELLKAMGIRGRAYKTYDASITAGEVFSQAPAPDSYVPYDGVVQYLISQGGSTNVVTMPNLVGAADSTARNRLKSLGVTARVVKVPSSSVAKGNVIATMPTSGGKAAKGGSVGLLVSTGSATTGTVPQVTGTPSAEASATIKQAGFTPRIVELPSAETSTGQVVGQFPAAQTVWTLRLPVVIVVGKQ